jgi:hypothetical protein
VTRALRRGKKQWARDLDRDNLLWREFCRPIEVETGSKEDLAIQLTEGWILGCSPTVTLIAGLSSNSCNCVRS